ncbi:MAG: alpha-amylase family glycosyl hydrolase, partial [Ilumatobacteraceae bacterium]
MLRSRVRALSLATWLAVWGLVGSGIATSTVALSRPAVAEAKVITIAGSLQSELGCPADWQPACVASRLTLSGPDTYSAVFALPAGAYEFKVTVNESWAENYGAGGTPDGANIPLVLAGPAMLEFVYSDITHVVSITPTDLGGGETSADRALAGDSLRAPLTKEQFYFVMTDRFANGDPTNDSGGYAGGRLSSGYDPTAKGFYHGGDLNGLIGKLDYIKDLGTTAIWLTPSFANKPVQGPPGQESAGYHGYWITDFTRIDPHLGTNDDLRTLITNAHRKGMKVFFDIITNHTADVIDYTQQEYSYVSKDTAPYLDASGVPFDDRDYVNSPDFPPMNVDSFPRTPTFRTDADATAKTPAWLNDVTLYHNRGNSTFAGESAEYGDFVGLDDLFTEHPAVEQGMEDVYRTWIDLGIDGFRIDTAKHVNIEFWQQFSPAMLEHADSVGTPNFFMFGEVFDPNPAFQSIYTTAGALPATLDFGFQSAAIAVTNGRATSTLADLFSGDDYYTDTDSNAYNLPTFLGNHDMGRVGNFVGGSMAKVLFANALMFTLRGQPVVYYGDEQGFIGDGGDQDARQDMFASQVATYNDDAVIGGTPGSLDRYATSGPVYRAIAALARLRRDHRALQDGTQITRFASAAAGIFAVSRIDRRQQIEYLVVSNNSTTPQLASFSTYSDGHFRSIYGGGSTLRTGKDGQVSVTVPPLTVQVFRADHPVKKSKAAPAVAFESPAPGGVLAGRAEVRAAVPANELVQVSYAFRPVGTTPWQLLGTDDNAPYRVFHDVSGYPQGSLIEYRAILKDNAAHLSVSTTYGVVGTATTTGGGGGGFGSVVQPLAVSVPGSMNSEMGCAAGDWQPACPQAQLTLDRNDEIWKGAFTLPAESYEYKVAIESSWDENYGAGAVRDGPNIAFTTDGINPVRFYYDHRTHVVMSSAESAVVVAAGSFQSEMGCTADWMPDCMRSWLQDPDGDGVFSLSTTQVPMGSYEVKAALNLAWDVNYGDGGEPNGANIPFTVASNGLVTTFSFDSVSHVLSVSTASTESVPDLTV